MEHLIFSRCYSCDSLKQNVFIYFFLILTVNKKRGQKNQARSTVRLALVQNISEVSLMLCQDAGSDTGPEIPLPQRGLSSVKNKQNYLR